MPSTVQAAFAAEAVIQAAAGLALVLFPTEASKFLSKGSTPTAITPAMMIDLLQLTGIFFFALTIPLLIALPDGPAAYERRRFTYWLLGGAEVLLIPFLTWKAVGNTSGMDTAKCFQLVGGMVPFLGFRIWAVWVKRDILRVSSDAKKNS